MVRTEGKAFASAASWTPEAFLNLPVLRRASKSATTRKVEADFALGDCLYFYGGHACPDFGDIVLAYDETMADDDGGSATPFDTGGLHNGMVRHDGRVTPGEYCAQQHTS